MARMDLTIRKLAQLAGTSYSTVSRALNDSPLVKDSTKRRIRRLAQDLGYQVDFSARSLATGMRMIVGVVYPYHTLRPHESMYTSQAIDRIRIALSSHGFDTLTAGYAEDGGPREDIARLIREKKADALLVFGHEVSDRQIAELRELGAEFLLINPPPRSSVDACHHISIDHEYGGFLAGRRLVEASRTRLLCIARP
jgi:Transcriptional regulators